MAIIERNIADNLDQLLDILPAEIRSRLNQEPDLDSLLEVVLDLGRPPEARYPKRVLYLRDEAVTHEEIQHAVTRVGSFGGDNRAGIERTLHRISAIRNRRGDVIGLTCRVGRAIQGTIDIVRDLVESGRSILMMGRPGVGKCVVGDTLIPTEQGLRPIREFVPADAANESFHPLRVRLASMAGVESTSHGYYDGVRQTRRITTRMGFELEGTLNHPILVIEPGGDLVFKPLGDVQPGDRPAIGRHAGLFGRQTALPGWTFDLRTNASDVCQIPTELSPGLARYLGYLVAEGTTTYAYSTVFSNDDADVVADMTSLASDLFALTMKPKVGKATWNGRDYRIDGRKHRAFLAHLGLDYVRAADKRVPDCILNAPREMVAAFLQGYFEGEGSIGRQHGIEVSSASETLLRQVQLLLLNFGIVAKRRARLNKRYGRSYHYLSIKGDNVQRYAEAIGFASAAKRTRLAAVSDMVRNPNLDLIPHLRQSLIALRAQVAMHQPKSRELVAAGGQTMPSLVSGYKQAHPTLSKYSRLERDPSYDTLGRILDETRDLDASPIRQRLQALYESHFYFDEVVAVTTGEAPVYDFTVPVSHSFVGNGFINHNTTKLREMARILADDLGKRVIIIDTSNEIAGDGDIAHPAIGRARRMQVPTPERQHAVMIEAVENHMPEVIIIDEISTQEEADAARTIAERGVQLIGTAHGNSIENLMMNPSLNDLVGGIQSVTLSDEEARRRGTQKTVLERKAPPTFDIAIEIQDRYRLAVHQDVAEVIDQLLRGWPPQPEIRLIDDAGEIHVFHERAQDLSGQAEAVVGERGHQLKIFPYAVSRSQLERVVRSMRMPATVTKNLDDADIILILKSYAKGSAKIMALAEDRQVPVYVVKSNTIPQIQKTLREVMHLDSTGGNGHGHAPNDAASEEEQALDEARTAIEQVAINNQPVDLAPREAAIRRQQEQLIVEHHLRAEALGIEPARRLRVYPRGMF